MESQIEDLKNYTKELIQKLDEIDPRQILQKSQGNTDGNNSISLQEKNYLLQEHLSNMSSESLMQSNSSHVMQLNSNISCPNLIIYSAKNIEQNGQIELKNEGIILTKSNFVSKNSISAKNLLTGARNAFLYDSFSIENALMMYIAEKVALISEKQTVYLGGGNSYEYISKIAKICAGKLSIIADSIFLCGDTTTTEQTFIKAANLLISTMDLICHRHQVNYFGRKNRRREEIHTTTITNHHFTHKSNGDIILNVDNDFQMRGNSIVAQKFELNFEGTAQFLDVKNVSIQNIHTNVKGGTFRRAKEIFECYSSQISVGASIVANEISINSQNGKLLSFTNCNISGIDQKAKCEIDTQKAEVKILLGKNEWHYERFSKYKGLAWLKNQMYADEIFRPSIPRIDANINIKAQLTTIETIANRILNYEGMIKVSKGEFKRITVQEEIINIVQNKTVQGPSKALCMLVAATITFLTCGYGGGIGATLLGIAEASLACMLVNTTLNVVLTKIIISTLSNFNNPKQIFKEVFSKDTLKSILRANATAVFEKCFLQNFMGLGPTGNSLLNLTELSKKTCSLVLKTLTDSLIYKNNFIDSLKGNFIDLVVMQLGDYFSTQIGKFSYSKESFIKYLTAIPHGIVGGFVSYFCKDAGSKDFLTGFLSGFLNKTLFNLFEDINITDPKDPLQYEKFISNAGVWKELSNFITSFVILFADGDIATSSMISNIVINNNCFKSILKQFRDILHDFEDLVFIPFEAVGDSVTQICKDAKNVVTIPVRIPGRLCRLGWVGGKYTLGFIDEAEFSREYKERWDKISKDRKNLLEIPLHEPFKIVKPIFKMMGGFRIISDRFLYSLGTTACNSVGLIDYTPELYNQDRENWNETRNKYYEWVDKKIWEPNYIDIASFIYTGGLATAAKMGLSKGVPFVFKNYLKTTAINTFESFTSKDGKGYGFQKGFEFDQNMDHLDNILNGQNFNIKDFKKNSLINIIGRGLEWANSPDPNSNKDQNEEKSENDFLGNKRKR